MAFLVVMFSTLGYKFTLWILVGLASALMGGAGIKRHIILGLFNLRLPSGARAVGNSSCSIWA